MELLLKGIEMVVMTLEYVWVIPNDLFAVDL
jgi:hypothetical protein